MTSPLATTPLVTFLALLGGCVWVGGFAAIAVTSSVARQQLDPAARVAFFRTLGRRWLCVSTPALVVALGAGAVLLADRPWDEASLAAVVLSAGLVLVTAVGVSQARTMTWLRALAVADEDEVVARRLRRGAAQARALRIAIGLVSLVLLALASALAS